MNGRPRLSASGDPVTAELEGGRLLDQVDELAATGTADPVAGGRTRLAWSPEYRQALSVVAGWADHPAVVVRRDPVGSLIADLDGTEPTLPPLVVGSHLDTVVGAGKLDGAYGVVAAFAIVVGLARAGERLRHPVRAVAWVNEEGVVAPPFTGSAAAAGLPIDLDAPGLDGRCIRDRLRDCGGDADAVGSVAWSAIAAYLELHVEQGPVLDRVGIPVGVVTGITGSRRGWIRYLGESNHAGTTPMDARRDALTAVAHTVLAVERLATDGPAATATAGAVEASPGNMNVIAGRASVSFDIRSLSEAAMDESLAMLRDRVQHIAASTRTEACLTVIDSTGPVLTDPVLRDTVRDASSGLGLPTMDVASGAGHDALKMARLGPVGMIFVPSIAGVSHNAEEKTRPGDLVAGAQVLLAALRLADERILERQDR